MNAHVPMSQPNGPEALVQSLLETLDDEREALCELGRQFNHQLEILRTSAAPGGDEIAEKASDVMGQLGHLRAARERQSRLLRRVLRIEGDDTSISGLATALGTHPALHSYAAGLLEARAAVRGEAQMTRHACEELNFALRYAAELGRELIQVAHDQMSPAAPKTYTAAGRTTRPASRSMLNQIG